MKYGHVKHSRLLYAIESNKILLFIYLGVCAGQLLVLRRICRFTLAFSNFPSVLSFIKFNVFEKIRPDVHVSALVMPSLGPKLFLHRLKETNKYYYINKCYFSLNLL